MNPEQDIRKAARRAGVDVVYEERPNGHVQVRGALLVNWYPYSKRSTAYVAGTRRGTRSADARQVVEMATTAPDRTQRKVKRRTYTAWKRRQFKKNRMCHWCRHAMILEPGTPDSATVEHVIPLARGGLDNDNNRVLAHERCNHRRGSDMPELET